MPLGVHLRREISVLFVLHIAIFAEQRHSLDGEGQHRAQTLLIEPLHETLLQPTERVPVRFLAVGETELAEYALEIVAVVVTDIPEHRLEITRTRRLVDGIHHLLERVGNHLIYSALALA